MKVAWYPEEIVAPVELTAVLVPQGKLSRKEWVEALSDRVAALAEKEPDPLQAANAACRKLDLPQVDNANQVGEALVKYNLNLLTNLNCQQRENQFPAKVSESKEEARQALKDVNLESWVELALSQVNVSDLA
jgi:hypothetical protein